MNGYWGKILKVDLTTSQISIDELPESFYRRYVGGNGFVAYYLLKELPKGADPLGPENLLIFAGGPFTGVPIAGGGRNAVGAKSPLTGGYGVSEVGGFFGAELRHAGFDALVIRGRADTPVYIWVHDNRVEIRPAGHLWGMSTLACQSAVRAELDDMRIRLAMIGPGGEKLVRYACIVNDVTHAAGRTGLGAVMGSKNLKCVAARGKASIPLADPEKIKDLAKWMSGQRQDKTWVLHELGTTSGVLIQQDKGALPTRNFLDGQFEGAEKISGQAMLETVLVGRGTCYACPVGCKRKVSDESHQVDQAYGGPEYETLAAFGSNCGVDDLPAICQANQLCNAYSLDTISTGVAVSFAMECFERGLLTQQDTGGLDLRFGNADAMVTLTQQICERQGLGNLLAEGLDVAAETIGHGAGDLAVHVKGQPFPMHECRTRHGQALGYAVSPTGADHVHNMFDDSLAFAQLGENWQSLGIYESIPRTELSPSKVRAYIAFTKWMWVMNHLPCCVLLPWSRDQIAQILIAITGWQTNQWEMIQAAERGMTMARLFNLREGLGRTDDVLPKRMAEFHVNGPFNEKPVLPQMLDDAVSVYYGMMGWDPRTGEPTKFKIQELDISWVNDVI
ncbi:MAG: aldehyde ferredoxin oxidoreductase family protein [Anaerolineales bacterium]|nr:aldehyde ferredoxin oxidoreductase family protein [Anaerolineales bacterium]